MDIQPKIILEMVDRIAKASTEDEVKINVDGFQRKLEGRLPSVMLQRLFVLDTEGRTESTPDRNERLKQEVADLASEKAELEERIAELQKRLRDIGAPVLPPATDGYYTMEQFLTVLTIKLRRTYGWRTDYVCASQQTEGCRPIANETIQKWQNANQVPDWAVEQIDRLCFRKRTGSVGPSWSEENEDFLAACYLRDPNLSNQALARLCEQHFGRPINENSIKGALDRLRKKNKISPKRPPRIKH